LLNLPLPFERYNPVSGERGRNVSTGAEWVTGTRMAQVWDHVNSEALSQACLRQCWPKHTKSFNLIDTLAVGVDRIQRNFEPLRRQVELWRKTQVTDERAKLILYNTFIDGALDAPRSLLPEVHRLYFEPEYPEFSARTMWSLSNAFTSAFKKLDPIPQFKATAKLGGFLAQLPA